MDKETIVQLLSDGVISNDAAAKYFPELKESKDECIKKELINAINLAYDCGIAITKENRDKYLAWIEKKGEQKPVDKVEPKFKVGNWVVYNNKHKSVYQIEKIENFQYTIRHILGGSMPLLFRYEDMIRLWTIQDAKDGDVLEFCDHGRLVVGIVSYVNKTTGQVDVNCLLENNNFKLGNYYNLDTIKPHPATKEQRELLFQKMKEAGYEWDEIKKKLKKIEDEPNVCDGCNNVKGCVACVDGSEWAHIEEQEPAWSERDDSNLEMAIWYIENPAPMVVKDSMLVFWLKSLKERIQPQPKQEWSEDDERMRQYVVNDLRFVKELVNDPNYAVTVERVEKEIGWMESLKDCISWKPSDEQMKILSIYANVHDVLASLYQDLKKLREE